MTVGKIPGGSSPVPLEPERPVAKAKSEKPAASTPTPKPTAETTKASLSDLANSEKAARPQENTGHTTLELASLSKRLQQMQEMQQARSEVSEINQTLQQTQRELRALSQETLGAFMANQPMAGSYWDRLDLVEKAQTINRLKGQIRSLQTDRAELVRTMREQVLGGTYEVSGGEILQGMMDEFF